VTETRARQPITPMRLFTDVSRVGSFVARLLLVAGMFGMFFFLTQFLQKAGVPAADSGAASGLVNMLQLVGGALGLGVLVAVYGTAVGHSAPTPHVVAHGIGTAFGFAAILDVCSLLVIIALITTGRLAPAVAPAARPKEEVVAS
jgi:hypothetical protein